MIDVVRVLYAQPARPFTSSASGKGPRIFDIDVPVSGSFHVPYLGRSPWQTWTGMGTLTLWPRSRYSNTISWFRNADGLRGFSVPNDITTDADFAWTVSVADVDGDGDLDAISASQDDGKCTCGQIFMKGTYFPKQAINVKSVRLIQVLGRWVHQKMHPRQAHRRAER